MNVERYRDFSGRLFARSLADRVPLSATFETTHRCPFECAHCFNRALSAATEPSEPELTLAEQIRILDELADMGCLWLLLTGGEPLARADFLELYIYAKKKGFLVTLFTNAALVNDFIADALAEFPPFRIEVSVYGHTPETFERVTGVPGSYDRARKGIGLLRARKLALSLKSVAMTLNCHEIRKMKHWCEKDLGLTFRFDALITPRLDCARDPLAVRLEAHDVLALDVADSERMESLRQALEAHEKERPDPERVSALYSCGAGLNSLSIDPFGKLTLCSQSRDPQWDLRRHTVKDGWRDFLRDVRQQKRSTASRCADCVLVAICGNCPANALLENGDVESPIEFQCEVAHLRGLAALGRIPPHGPCPHCLDGLDDLTAVVNEVTACASPVEMSDLPSGATHAGWLEEQPSAQEGLHIATDPSGGAHSRRSGAGLLQDRRHHRAGRIQLQHRDRRMLDHRVLSPGSALARAESRNRLALGIGGLTLVARTDEEGISFAADGARGLFVHPVPEPPDIELEVGWSADWSQPSGETLFRSGSLWTAYRHQDHDIEYRFVSPAYGTEPYKRAVFEPRFNRGRIELNSQVLLGRQHDPLEYPLDELALVGALAAGLGLQAHASCAIDDRGRGLLFVGASGAGKSTMARYWQRIGATILSDDRVIVRPAPAGFALHGTPWHGEERLADPGAAPLAAVFFLDKGASHRLEDLSAADAVARLLAASFVPPFVPSAIDFALGFLGELVRAVPCRRLVFALNDDVVDFVERSLD